MKKVRRSVAGSVLLLAQLGVAGCGSEPSVHERRINFLGIPIKLKREIKDAPGVDGTKALDHVVSVSWQNCLNHCTDNPERDPAKAIGLVGVDGLPSFQYIRGSFQELIERGNRLLKQDDGDTPEFLSKGLSIPNVFYLEGSTVEEIFMVCRIFWRAVFETAQVDSLMKLMAGPENWEKAGEQAETLWPAFIHYFSDYFDGEYVDRNGTAIALDMDVLKNLAKQTQKIVRSRAIDDIDVSPEIAGQIFTVLMDYAGDAIFRVPIYAPRIAEIQKRLAERLAEINDEEQTLEERTPSYYENQVEKTPPDLRAHAREALLRQDAERWLALQRERESITEEKDAYEEDGYARVLNTFTPYEAGLIRRSPDKEGKDLVFGTPNLVFYATLRDKEGNWCVDRSKDYSDMMGRAIKKAGAAAEKQAKSSAGGVIRGGWVTGLDNEVVAEIIATIVGVLARKVAEEFAYELLKALVYGEVQFSGEYYDFFDGEWKDFNGKKTLLDALDEHL